MPNGCNEEGPVLRSARTVHAIEVSSTLQGGMHFPPNMNIRSEDTKSGPHSRTSKTSRSTGSASTTSIISRENATNPADCSNGNNQLAWDDLHRKLYEREEQHDKLLKAYRRRKASKSSELYLIEGISGSGKSALAMSMKGEVRRDGGFFCTGKFVAPSYGASCSSCNKPNAPFVSILRDLPEQIKSLNKGALTELQHRVAVKVGAEMHVLLDAAPALASVFPSELFDLPPAPSSAATHNNPAAAIVPSDQQQQQQQQRRHSLDLQVRQVVSEPPPRPTTSRNDLQARRLSNNTPLPPRRIPNNRQPWGSERNSTRLSTLSTASSITGTSPFKPLPQNHFAVVFKRFIRVICSTKISVVLLLDDLHWADPQSLELLEALLKHGNGDNERSHQQGLMIAATCRADEVRLDHPLAQALRHMEDETGVKILVTRVKNLSTSALAQMIADIIGLPAEECTPLAEIVFNETKGNALYAKQYIQSLHEDEQENILTSLPPENHKNTTEERIVQLLARQIKRFPQDVQYLLQVASCLRGNFNVPVLCYAAEQEESRVQDALALFSERHIVVYNEEFECWTFSHDKYQEAACSLIPVAERQRFHLKLGRTMQAQIPHEELQDYVVLIADLMIAGMDFLMDEEERENLALLCLDAGRQVAHTCSFAYAIDYMERGIRLLSLRHWRDQYCLSLDLFNAAAELAYCIGKHDQVDSLVSEIQKNARSFLDQLQAYMTSILSLGARGKSAEAISVGMDCLTQLGYPLPKGKFNIQRDFNKTQRSLQNISREDILNLSLIEDPKVMAAMTIIQMLHPIFSASAPEYTMATGSRLVRLTLKHGLGPMSSIGFALYGLSLVRLGKAEEGYQYAKLGLHLLELLDNSRECSVKVFLTLAVGPVPAKKPYSQALELMRQASHIGLETGDIETALRASMCNGLLRFYLGDPLWSVAKTLRDLSTLCADYGSFHTNQAVQPYLFVCLQLVGCKEKLDKDLISRTVAESTNDNLLLYTLYAYFYLAMYLNELDIIDMLTAELHKRKTSAQWVLPFSKTYQLFCEGVAAASQGRTNKARLRVARKKLAKLKQQGEHSPSNIWNKVCLIEAELEACSGRTDSAILLYDKAIQLAEKQGFVNEQALACEKAGLVLMTSGRAGDADWYITRARALYRRWGANKKVDQLVKLLNHDKHAKCYVASGSGGGSLQAD